MLGVIVFSGGADRRSLIRPTRAPRELCEIEAPAVPDGCNPWALLVQRGSSASTERTVDGFHMRRQGYRCCYVAGVT